MLDLLESELAAFEATLRITRSSLDELRSQVSGQLPGPDDKPNP
jgi:hypothetical protein